MSYTILATDSYDGVDHTQVDFGITFASYTGIVRGASYVTAPNQLGLPSLPFAIPDYVLTTNTVVGVFAQPDFGVTVTPSDCPPQLPVPNQQLYPRRT